MSRLESFSLESKVLGRKRKLRVWLPDEYLEEERNAFPVLLQQDGQIAFSDRDAELPYGSWRLDVCLDQLARAGSIRPTIAIGIDNSPARMKEYFPVTEQFRMYEQFVTTELLPWVRREFHTIDSPDNTFLMGSSMGGMVSFALAASHPRLFGGCACLSPWFEYDNNQYIHEVLRPMQDKPPIRVYMDSGIRDWRELDDGHRGMMLARNELLRLGFIEGYDFDWMVDTWFPAEADLADSLVQPDRRATALTNQHNEFQWNRRLERPLRFLLAWK